tara:strand:- start:615 stop:923 length:309 start_codon:yes stop_codon:yes gene_type:complete
MGETAEERLRRLALEYRRVIFEWDVNPRGGHPSVLDDTNDYERMLDDTCREMIDEVLDEITDKVSEDVSLVKKYDMGTFKFVNEKPINMRKEKYDLIINYFK